MNSQPILISFARSGGTLTNQLLGSHPDCLVLSEVNPAGSVVPIWKQAGDWLHLLAPDDLPGFRRLAYGEQIRRLRELAGRIGKTLLVRDWVTLNFLPNASLCGVPSGQLEQFPYLERAGLVPAPVVVARRSRAIYRSIVRNFPHMRHLTLADFAAHYLAYARAVHRFPRFHLESLQSAPRETLTDLLAAFSLSDAFVDRQCATFGEFRACTGNNTLAEPAPTSRLGQVVVTEADAVDRLDASALPDALLESDRLLGYGP